jgi:hypothetical protein
LPSVAWPLGITIPTSHTPIPTGTHKLDAFPSESLSALRRNYCLEWSGIRILLPNVGQLPRNDSSHTVTVTCIVTRVEWRNPHVSLYLAVIAADGSQTEWRMEMRGATALAAGGLDQNIIIPGIQVSADVWLSKAGGKQANVRRLMLPDGKDIDVGDRWPEC